jgi:hypothetical protein
MRDGFPKTPPRHKDSFISRGIIAMKKNASVAISDIIC